jgi:hypothetical protein
LQSIEDAIDSLISPDSLRRELFGHERLVSTLYKAIKPDPAALEFFNIVICLSTLVEAIRVRLNPNPPDISKIMGSISDILDESITGLAIRKEGPAALDLSKINFQALSEKFKESKHKNTDLESLKAAIHAKLEKLIQVNKTRADFSEKFEELIESYNTGSRTIEEIFAELLNFTNTLNAEEERHVRENMSEEELVIFDILNMEFRYLNPLTFEEMINNWESECTKMRCNFMSVEYPEFTQPGGYQLAINAKPLFIKKALELCMPLGVLYIDGDMYVRKYPNIFDMPDVDFMARGWWIDPRSSYKMDESIMYDPYTFETSGGTMFFSQSSESKFLIQKWVSESSKTYNKGKADDRILSLVFNTNDNASATPMMILNTSGNLGFGTAATSYKLFVKSAPSRPKLFFNSKIPIFLSNILKSSVICFLLSFASLEFVIMFSSDFIPDLICCSCSFRFSISRFLASAAL